MSAANEPATIVVFRVDKGSSPDNVTAFFPELPAGDGLITCYAHIGQHGAASWSYVTTRTRPATPDEYAELARELEAVGYRLAIRRRRRSWRIEKAGGATVTTGRILDSTATPLGALTIVRDFFLLCDAVERGHIDPESVDWSAYRSRCRGALTIANVWGFESNRPLEEREP